MNTRTLCDICYQLGVKRPAVYDAKTKMGPWANVCVTHFKTHGVGLGLGKGQRLVSLLLALAMLWFIPCYGGQTPVLPRNYVERLASSIYRAEGGLKTRHPYGILKRYKHTTPHQACINTINHQYRNWIHAGSPGHFLHYLAQHYAPIGAGNDDGTNKNWEKNVRYFMGVK